jgi:TetR/AcrR family tetracycline transcriptional repressor
VGVTAKLDRRLSRDEIVVVARRLLAEVGVEGLSMRRVGEACGVRGPALYWHFKDKDELLGLIVDSVSEELDSGSEDQPWDERLKVLAHSVRRLMVAHPGLATVAAGRYRMTDRVAGNVDELLRGLAGAGFTRRQAIAIHYGVLAFVTGFVIYETSSPVFAALADTPPGHPARREQGAGLVELAGDRLRHLAEATRELEDLTVDELFEPALAALVDGWARQLRP